MFKEDWNWLVAYNSYGVRSRIIVFWRESSVSIFSSHITDQLVSCDVLFKNSNLTGRVILIYAGNREAQRLTLWQDLKAVTQGVPCILLGDLMLH